MRKINLLTKEESNIKVIGKISNIQIEELKNGLKITTIKIEDETGIITGKEITKESTSLEENKTYEFLGSTKYDLYSKELVFFIRKIKLLKDDLNDKNNTCK